MNRIGIDNVAALIDALRAAIDATLADRFVGLYVFGSLATGAFEPATSDIDLVAALTDDLDDGEIARLARMHVDIVRRIPDWDDRIEVGYIALARMRQIAPTDPIALVSPSEPFHRKDAGNDWFFNLYVLREHGITIFGPPPAAFIDPITLDDVRERLRPFMREWRTWIAETPLIHERTYQSHMIITMCRNLYLFTNGTIASKRDAAAWAAREIPDSSGLIRDALAWREAGRDAAVDGDATLPQTLRFVHGAIDAILG